MLVNLIKGIQNLCRRENKRKQKAKAAEKEA